jgi:hypothetical protein
MSPTLPLMAAVYPAICRTASVMMSMMRMPAPSAASSAMATDRACAGGNEYALGHDVFPCRSHEGCAFLLQALYPSARDIEPADGYGVSVGPWSALGPLRV